MKFNKILFLFFCFTFINPSYGQIKPDNKPTVYYFYDPLCLWCYGFSTHLKQFENDYKNDFNFKFLSGGIYHVANGHSLKDYHDFYITNKEYLNELCGKDISDSFLLMSKNGNDIPFSSDVCNQVLETLKQIHPDSSVSYIGQIQSLIYTKSLRYDKLDSYFPFINSKGISKEDFLSVYQKNSTTESKQMSYNRAQEAGVSSYPTIIISVNGKLHWIMEGYLSLVEVEKKIKKLNLIKKK